MRKLFLAVGGCTLGIVAVAAAACGGGGDEPRLTVAAAADLQYAFNDLEGPFEDECRCDLVLIFGSSGKFAAQIAEGFPVDVFASANSAYVDDLEARGLVISETKQVYATGRLVLAVPARSAREPSSLDVLLDPAVSRLSIANPEHAPYGVAAREVLESKGFWNRVQHKLVLGENAAQASQFLETGDVQAGIIPLSLAVQREDKLRYILIDDRLHNPLHQTAAVVSGTGRPDLSASFIQFVGSPEGRAVMARYGFAPAPEQAAGQ